MFIPWRTPKTAPEGTVATSQLADGEADAGACAGVNTLAHPASNAMREVGIRTDRLGMECIADTRQATGAAEEMDFAG
jgi:hypothetical protein